MNLWLFRSGLVYLFFGNHWTHFDNEFTYMHAFMDPIYSQSSFGSSTNCIIILHC